MGFRDEDNNIVGFDIDVAREVCSRMGVELELMPIDWDSKVSELNDGKVDCLWNGFTTSPEREAEMTMSQPYMKNRQVVVTLKDSAINTVDDLKDKTLVLPGRFHSGGCAGGPSGNQGRPQGSGQGQEQRRGHV